MPRMVKKSRTTVVKAKRVSKSKVKATKPVPAKVEKQAAPQAPETQNKSVDASKVATNSNSLLKAVALANNTSTLILWSLAKAIPDCAGMAVRRRYKSTGKVVVLPAWVPFEGEDNLAWEPKTTEVWPVQGMRWKDTSFREQEVEVEYQVVPMVGKPGVLKAREDLAVWTNPVKLSTQCGPYIQCGFTRSILSSQGLLKDLGMRGNSPDLEVVRKRIATKGDPIREELANGILDLAMAPLAYAVANKGHTYEARYEVSDPEAIERYLKNKDVVSIILGNTGKTDSTNKVARAQMHAAMMDIIDRILDEAFIPHNKSGVGFDAKKVAQIISGGSTNLTPEGMCCQWNNAVVILSTMLGQLYKDEWDLLKADKSQSGPALRAANAKRKPEVVLPDGTRIQTWFSPNMKQREKPKTNPAEPPDMADFRQHLKGADQAFFLFFIPGNPSLLNDIADLSKDPKVFVRGAVNSAQSIPNGVKIYKRPGAPPVVVTASYVERQVASWMKEIGLLPGAHALIHSKVMVINPFDPENCVVLIMSHNGGYKASYQNDENELIVIGNQLLAMRYLVHIDDCWSHYVMRNAINQAGKSTDSTTPSAPTTPTAPTAPTKKRKPTKQPKPTRKPTKSPTKKRKLTTEQPKSSEQAISQSSSQSSPANGSTGYHLVGNDSWQQPYMEAGPRRDEMFMWTSAKLPSFV